MPDREPLDVLDAIHSTRAMRYLKPDPIPDDLLWAILDAAIRGPTGGNTQGWGWVVVSSESICAQPILSLTTVGGNQGMPRGVPHSGQRSFDPLRS